MDTENLSSVAKLELNVADCMYPENTVHHDDASSSMRKARLALKAAKQYNDAVELRVKAIARNNPETSQLLHKNVAPPTQMQVIVDRLEEVDKLFYKREIPERPGIELEPQMAATLRSRRSANDTVRALLYGAIALRPVEGRSAVSNATGWNAISNFAHSAAALSSAGTSAIPHIGGFISAPIKGADTLLGVYSTYDFNRINRAVSQAFKQTEVESYSEALANGKALMKAHTLPEKRSRFERLLLDEAMYRTAQLSGTAAGISKQEKIDENLAGVQAVKAVLDLAFGEALGVPEAQAAHHLRGMTTEQKAEATLRHSCKVEKLTYKPHLVLCRPSLNEQSRSAVKGLTVSVLDTVHSSLTYTERLEAKLSAQDAVIQKQGEALKALKDAIRKLGGDLPSSEETLRDKPHKEAKHEEVVSLRQIELDSALSDNPLERETRHGSDESAGSQQNIQRPILSAARQEFSWLRADVARDQSLQPRPRSGESDTPSQQSAAAALESGATYKGKEKAQISRGRSGQ